MIALLMSYFVLWTFEPTAPSDMGSTPRPVRDVLEVQNVLGGPWIEIPGPYRLTTDKKDYCVDVGSEGIKFFRINRWWGEPWVVPTPAESIWPSSTVPGMVDSGLAGDFELGVKFHSDTAGSIIGIRFFKSAANTGIHVGSLWGLDGTLLASTTFSEETASGWQQVNFLTPVSISPNTTYIASYSCPSGHFSWDANYFTAPRYNPPLHAENGVVNYDPNRFPSQTYFDSNFWVDVVFQ